jgi:hypothetical protein
MDINFDIIGACANIRAEAETLVGQGNYAYNLKKQTGALYFITSPDNNPNVSTNFISYNSGKKYATLQMFYDQRTKECQISDNCDITVCDEGSTPQRKEAIVRITKCVKTPVREYATRDMIALCMNKQEFIQKRAGSDLRAGLEFLSTRILAEMQGEIGINKEWDGTTTEAGQYKPIQLIKNNIDSQGQRGPLPGNWAEVMLDYENNQLGGTPGAIGQGNLQMFYKLHGWSCCNATTPYGEANLDGDARFYLDQSANAVFGVNKFVLVAPGALKLVTFNVNEDIDINDDSVVHTTIADPHGYPLRWDMDAYWDHCSKTWKVMFSFMWEVFNIFQPDSFAASGEADSPDSSPDCADPLDGMLGVFGYEATAA